MNLGAARMSSNPANILIARSSRSANTLSALVPTETHAAASAIFPRSSSSPPWLLEEAGVEDIDELEVSDDGGDTEPIDVDITFRYVPLITVRKVGDLPRPKCTLLILSDLDAMQAMLVLLR